MTSRKRCASQGLPADQRARAEEARRAAEQERLLKQAKAVSSSGDLAAVEALLARVRDAGVAPEKTRALETQAGLLRDLDAATAARDADAISRGLVAFEAAVGSRARDASGPTVAAALAARHALRLEAAERERQQRARAAGPSSPPRAPGARPGASEASPGKGGRAGVRPEPSGRSAGGLSGERSGSQKAFKKEIAYESWLEAKRKEEQEQASGTCGRCDVHILGGLCGDTCV